MKPWTVGFAAIAVLVGAGHGELAVASIAVWSNNGHSYEVIVDSNPTWFAARDAATARTHNGVNGYLATLTTAAEQDFIVSSFGGGTAVNQLWVGGYQDTSALDYSETGGGWRWITSESWNTGVDSPAFSFNNNYWFTHSEEHLITWWNTGGLNDYYHSPSAAINPVVALGYIVEFDTEPDVVPEPSTLAIWSLLALCGIGYGRRRRKT